jgi:hypothetical protein
MPFASRFTITNPITTARIAIERALGFLEAAMLSQDWIERMSRRALLLEAHHTTHTESAQLRDLSCFTNHCHPKITKFAILGSRRPCIVQCLAAM